MTDTIDVCFSFDTTGSMYPCLSEVRRRLHDTLERLFSEIPNLRVALIAHGDYCDNFRDNSYVVTSLDFNSDVDMCTTFVDNVRRTSGGDAPECYEYVMNHARSELDWQGDQRVFVLIGDAQPHTKSIESTKWGLPPPGLAARGTSAGGFWCDNP